VTKLTQIENALRAINEARFQDLCDHYLYREGYQRINRIGAKAGKEKTVKGRPDTLLSLPNGRYVFVEATTQETGLFEKLVGDVDECFDETKTGVPVEKIERIILCHNSKLSSAEEEALTVKGQERGCLLDILGLGSFSFGLLEKHQILAKEYLEIELDTGQILSPADFIKRYQKSAFATPLDLKFHFRGAELKGALDALETNDLLIIAGPAGVGKSRFALECMSRFVEQLPSYQSFGIFNKRLALYEDLKAYFGSDGQYLLFVDDANHLSQLDLLLQLLHEQRDNHHTKIILTVRDYALVNVRKVAREYAAQTELQLEPFKNEEISEIVEAEFGIRNHVYLERICKIAKGNPRLAVMAAKLAKETNRFDSILDASNLYDEYFTSIADDFTELESAKLLKIGAILAFFGSLDRTAALFSRVAQSFGLSETEFWEGIERLHAAELVDLYENEVVKISDQVLGTYLFYRAFFKVESADLSVLLSDYFGDYEYKFREGIYPVLDTFNHQFISERLQKHVDAEWRAAGGDEAKLLRLMRVFWFLKKEETLLFLKDRIDSLPNAPTDFAKLTYEPESQGLLNDKYLDVLEAFQHASGENFHIAFDLILEYLEKQPGLLSQVLYLLLERFCFEVDSYDHGYITQKVVVESLIEKSSDKETGLLHKRLLLRIADKYLKTQFRTHRSEGLKILIREFRLLPSPELLELRKRLWDFVGKSSCEPETRDIAFQLIVDHATRFHDTLVNETTNQIVEADSLILLPTLKASLDPSSYMDTVLMQQYLRFLRQHKVAIEKNLEKRFTNETYHLSNILLPDWDEDFEKRRDEAFRKEFSGYVYSDYVRFFELCREIQKHIAEDYKVHLLASGIEIILMNLAQDDLVLFKKVVKHLLEDGNKLGHIYPRVIGKLCSIYSSPRYAYNLLKRNEYQSKESWLLAFFSLLQPSKINRYHVNELYSFYQTADLRLFRDFDFLESYARFDPNVLVNLVKTVLERSKPDQPANFHYLFNPNTHVFKSMKRLFGQHVDLLEEAYLHQSAIDDLVNYRGAVLRQIVELDRNFLLKYLEWLYGGDGYVSEPMNGARYAALWELEDHGEIITGAVEFVFEKEKSDYPRSFNYVNAFFRRNDDDSSSEVKPSVSERMLAFISAFIEKHHQDRQRMIFIFGVITECFPSERLRFLKLFLSHNQDVDTFERLTIEPRSWSATGSAVPVFEKKIKFLESILPLLSTTALLKHKLHINNMIIGWKERIEDATKRDFLGHF